ncbi:MULTISPECIES: DUF1345 domain-containing protein [Amycolatopsis]|uniref:Putative membrane protein n=1 Tax=Amycolatopsis thermoflava TaxID=84480 RepID=A0A3N2GPX1_9PSEU|nr:DUF1345 domain-containing protein [Amycolatopsis thermoflava]ROS38651.1 putative membrane protein [Amycolatopsis thermoflava]
MLKKASFAVSRLIEFALLALGVLVFVFDDPVFVMWWDLLAAVYLGVRIRRVARKTAGTDWRRSLLGGRGGLFFTVFTSVVGITCGLTIVLGTGDDLVARVFGVPAVLLAWAILHFGYAERYAHAYYRALPERQFAFPDTETPVFADFAYFAFTVGTTFAVSDVETRTTAARSRVLSHGVLSFLYNTATLGVAIGVITGS